MAGDARRLTDRVKVDAGPAQQVGQGIFVLQRFAQQTLGIRVGQSGWAHPGGAQALHFTCQPLALQAEGGPAAVIHQTQVAARFSQAQISVVFAQLQAEFGAACEHAVRLGDALADEVVYQHAQVSLVPPRQPGGAPLNLQRRIDAGVQALRSGFFVASGAVDLARKVQAGDGSCLEARAQLPRVEVVVLDGIPGPQDVRLFQPAHGLDGGDLHVIGQGRGNAVWVELMRGQAFGFQKNLVRMLVRKAMNLVFDARAVARAHAVDDAGEHGAAVEPAANDVVRECVGMRDPARHLARMAFCRAQKAEYRHRVQVTGLHLQL